MQVAIVGRTGAGKSSLLMALFRLADLADGSISVDGVDTGKLNLKELRSRLSILPQEPSLFQGTLRSNLDPFNRYGDEELLAVANKCYLTDVMNAAKKGLLLEIAPNGSNVSLGTAQLVCLARALLNHSKVLVLDEVRAHPPMAPHALGGSADAPFAFRSNKDGMQATAALDLETDRKVQRVIRTEFADRTIITIAHR